MKSIIIRLGSGSLTQGFPGVYVELKGDGINGWGESTSLLPAPDLKTKYDAWERVYRASVRLGIGRHPINFDPSTVTNIGLPDIHQVKSDLIAALNHWLCQGDFARIQAQLRTDLHPNDRISLSIITTDDTFLWKLPWHHWDFCKAYTHCVESFSKSHIQSNLQQRLRPNGRVDILAIWGHAPELGLAKDLAALQQPLSRVTHCQPKSAIDISDTLIEQQQIRILFFGGHGETIELELEANTQSIGTIYLDKDTPISISKIKADLKQAIERGLQIAIFNCCSGLGLAQELADLNLPYLVVMRSQIPDKLAQKFCQDLLSTYSEGGDFTTAFDYARRRLVTRTDRHDEFESWLPMLVHNPQSNRVTWQDLSRSWWQLPAPQPLIRARRELTKPDRLPLTWIGISLLSTALTIGLQTLAPIKQLESLAIDRLQYAQVKMLPVSSHTILVDINDGEIIVIGGKSTSSGSPLQPLANLPFLALGSDLKIESEQIDNWLKQSNVSINCEDKSPTMTYPPIDRLRDCQPLAWAVMQNYLIAAHSKPIDRPIILNPHLAPTIELIKLSDLSKQNPNLFKGKFVVAGIVKDRSSPAMIQAIAIEQIARSINNFQPLLTAASQSDSIIYILIWAGIGGGAIFYRRRLLLPIVVVTSLGTGAILFTCGYLLPLIPTAIGVGISSYLVCLIKLPNKSN